MKALIILILFSLLIINNVSAATIHGSVYDISLNKVKDIIIEIDSVPVQRFISNDGSYSFELSNGNYRITAKILPNTKIAEESININSDGSFNIDLFIDINIPESELLNDINEDYTKDLSIKDCKIIDEHSLKKEFLAFYNCIANNSKPTVTLDDGFKALKVANEIIDKIKVSADF